eukprot:2398225-Rhodomonas_salina.4
MDSAEGSFPTSTPCSTATALDAECVAHRGSGSTRSLILRQLTCGSTGAPPQTAASPAQVRAFGHPSRDTGLEKYWKKGWEGKLRLGRDRGTRASRVQDGEHCWWGVAGPD